MTTINNGSQTESWWKLGSAGWKAVLKNAGGEFKSDEVAYLSAVVTLRIVLALVPGLIAAVAIAAQVISTEDIRSLVTSAGDIVPSSAQGFVTDSLDKAIKGLAEKGIPALAVSIAVGLFTASSAAAALIYALNKAYDADEGRGFVGQRVASLGVIGGLVLALIGMFIVIVLGPTLLETLLPQQILDSPLSILITLGRYVAGITVLMLFFGFTFWFGPNRDRPKLRFLTPGAVLGVIGWLVLSYLFSLFVRLAGNYSATYGAFAGVIVLLVWLNYSFIVLLMGAELDHEIDKYLQRRQPVAAAPAIAPVLDPDTVTQDMPRHPGLMAATGDPDDEAADQVAGPGRWRIRLRGAAARTSGARLASTLWGKLGRD
ncbi:MAG: YihY/virulence factor BrkB family protein [Euzebya sp.]